MNRPGKRVSAEKGKLIKLGPEENSDFKNNRQSAR